VLVVLRGYPGYQCPVCTAQVAELVGRAGRFRDAGARVILVYPGPAQGLKAHADEFVRGKALPENFDLLLDPDYALTQCYGLRWDAPNETAYPSAFVLDRGRKVRYAKVSHSHAGRAKAEELLEALAR
jgi:peroxiredoxin